MRRSADRIAMTLFAWMVLFAAVSLLARWITSWGGAEWLEGWRASLFIDWIHAWSWEAEQIRLYALLLWVIHAIWFAVGVFVPAARFMP